MSCMYMSHLSTVALYAWENPEYKVVEDSDSMVAQLCLVSESGTLSFPIEISVISVAISATGTSVYIFLNLASFCERRG